MRNGEWPRYAARPYVCGAMGAYDPARLELLTKAGPSVHLAHRSPGAALFASTPLAPYAGTATGAVEPPPGAGGGPGHTSAAYAGTGADAGPDYASAPHVGTSAGAGPGHTSATHAGAGPGADAGLGLASAGRTATGGVSFAWGERRPEGAASWLAVAETWEAPGLIDAPGAVTLHTGAFGLVDVYYLDDGDAIYFAGAIEPLLALARRPYEVNWDAWAAILKLTYPLLEDTPYREIRRLPGSTALVWSRETRRVSVDRRAPRWVREEPFDRGVTGGDMVALLHEALKPFDDRPVLVPVSGGYDSRLLASIAVARRMDVRSWTTSPDDGLDNDLDFARYVTRELGIPHRVVPQDAADHPAEARWAARRLEYLTSHHAWYSPFAREVHKEGRPVVDGLAGGPLMKNFLITADAVGAGSTADRQAALLAALATGEPHLPMLSDQALAFMDDRVGTAFARATSMLRGHRSELPLSVLHTRTARGIARSPVNLVGPEVTPVFPFLHPDLFDAALSVPVDRKEGGRFYQEILRAANPRVAALPTTNGALPHRRVPLRSGGPAAREWNHRMLVNAARVPGLLSEPMLEVVGRGPDALTDFGSWNSRFWLRGLVLFGSWIADYGDVLGDLTPPWAETP
ncbi:asparagine synthetase B family protein [Sphaerisporangium sp. TRM90804]|uniref:asparagine synthetase B family protein n=1 Tax=Sphaerisporangium sp. TRM90804 TaxID=3031113 RepID=UPI00244AD730|nr:asparagine synthetase B family protein [Sphaerisporangium sp. TRM90804]MDH2428096.1 asparagine synthase-related protein [Sphaerisporangium sp. TRM90804]